MNEGCDGGQAIYSGFLIENGHLVEETCAPYAQAQQFDGCSKYSKCGKIAKVSRSYYVGGVKRKPTVEEIQQEIATNGPVAAEINNEESPSYKQSGADFINGDAQFTFYKSGILRQDADKPSSYVTLSKPSKEPMTDKMTDGTSDTATSVAEQEKLIENLDAEIKRTEKVMKKHHKEDGPAQDSSLLQLQGKTTLKAKTKSGFGTQHLNHSIIILGWKKEKDPKDGQEIPVWICRNSYGSEFGMNGDFYVRMGQDDFGIESEVHAYEVESLSG